MKKITFFLVLVIFISLTTTVYAGEKEFYGVYGGHTSDNDVYIIRNNLRSKGWLTMEIPTWAGGDSNITTKPSYIYQPHKGNQDDFLYWSGHGLRDGTLYYNIHRTKRSDGTYYVFLRHPLEDWEMSRIEEYLENCSERNYED